MRWFFPLDNDSLIGTVLAILALVAFSAFFSATETSITSASRPRLKNLAKEGSGRAKKILQRIDNYDKTLSTILVGNNLVNILASSLCTVMFTSLFGSGGVGTATLVMTVFILLFGEISPKMLAKEQPEKFAMFASPLLSVIAVILTPVTWLFGLWQKLLKRVIKAEETPSITGDELAVLVEEGEKEGALGSGESELIQSAIEFDEISVREILTPRVDVVMVEDVDPAEKLYELFRLHHHSRIPVYHETVDNVVGIIHEKDFYPAFLNDRNVPLSGLLHKPLFIPDAMKISDLLARLRREKTHIAVVIDQYGGVEGIVTMEDVLEELVGEIYDESDVELPPIEQTGEDTWLVSGSASVDDVFEAMGLSRDDDDEIESNTVGGLATELAGRLPDVGDSFVYGSIGLTVRRVTDRRVDQLEVTRLAPPPSEDEE